MENMNAKTVVLASHNHGKALEYEALLAPFGFKVATADAFGIDMEKAEETAETFGGNAKIKAEYAYKQLKGKYRVLADDSGICFWGLNGFPGVHSARWEPDGQKDYRYKNQKVIELLKDKKDKTCSFFCAICFIDEKGAHVFEGRADGTVPSEPHAKEGCGFGYDPIFFSPEIGKTFGEAGLEEKDRVSHRGHAVQQMLNYLKQGR